MKNSSLELEFYCAIATSLPAKKRNALRQQLNCIVSLNRTRAAEVMLNFSIERFGIDFGMTEVRDNGRL